MKKMNRIHKLLVRIQITWSVFFNTLVFLTLIISSVCFFVGPAFSEDPVDLRAEENMLREVFIYDANGNPDPLVPLLDQAGEDLSDGPSKEEELALRIQRINVNGVVWDEDMPLVMINHKIYKKGDKVIDLLIETINEDSVILSFKGLPRKISLIQKNNIDDQGGTNVDTQ